MKNAIVLCSGGLDSVTAAYYIKKRLEYSKMIILFFNYGQKAINLERKYAKNCSKKLRANFIEIKLEWLGEISNSLINKNGAIKKLSRKDLKDTLKESNKFYVPCRNTIFLNYALALAESIFLKNKQKYNIFTGFKCEGKESYPDTTKKFVEEMNKLSKIATCGLKIYAPLIEMDKEDIIGLGKKLGIKFDKTISCYSPINERHCGFCLACKLRQEGFYWANQKEDTKYNQD